MSESDVELVREALGAFIEHMGAREYDVGFERGYLDPEIEWVPAPELPEAGRVRGREAFVGFMRTWSEDFDDWSMEVEHLIDAGDGQVVAFMRQWATGRESGVPVELEFAQVWSLRDGRAIRIRNFLDRDRAMRETGLLGRPPGPDDEQGLDR